MPPLPNKGALLTAPWCSFSVDAISRFRMLFLASVFSVYDCSFCAKHKRFVLDLPVENKVLYSLPLFRVFPTHTPRGVWRGKGVYLCSCKVKTKTVCPQQQAEKKRKVVSIFTWGPPGDPKPGTGRKGADREGWVSDSARLGGGHGGWWQGENRVPWAMLVEGNGGIQREKASSQTQEFLEKKKGGENGTRWLHG